MHTPAAAMQLRYLGHSTVLVELAGLRILTDPVMRRRVGGLRRAVAQVTARQVADVDLVLVSHGHHDHLDVPSLRLLGHDVPVVVPAGLGRFLVRRGLTGVVELDAGDTMRVGPVTVTATEANHDGRRVLGPPARALGYLLHGGEQRVYFAGDTDLFPAMSRIGEGGLNVALLPVWGWGPTLGPGHLDPGRAAVAVALLRPQLAVPIHWGTYAPVGARPWMRRQLREPPLLFAAEVARRRLSTWVAVTAPGQRVAMEGS